MRIDKKVQQAYSAKSRAPKAEASAGKANASAPEKLAADTSAQEKRASENGAPEKLPSEAPPASAEKVLPEKTPSEKTSPAKSSLLKLITSREHALSLREIAGYLIIIGKEEASQVLSYLPEDIIEKITAEIASIDSLDSAERQRIVERFNIAISDPKETIRGGEGFARSLLEKALGSTGAQAILNKIFKPADELDFLNELEPHQLENLLAEESPRLLGIVISQLEPQRAAKYLQSLPDKRKSEIIQTMNNRVKLPKEVVQNIAGSIKKKILKTGTQQSPELDGVQVLAEILRSMDLRSEQSIMQGLAETDPQIQKSIQERLFTIEQVLHIQDRDFQSILADMTDDNIALLLKGKSEEIRHRFLSNVSSERARSVAEVYQFMGPVQRKDVDDATRAFVNKIRTMEEQGEITMYRESDEFLD